jgi:hypothetical protein
MSTLRTAEMYAGPHVLQRAMENMPSARFAKQIQDIGAVGRFADQLQAIGNVGRFGQGDRGAAPGLRRGPRQGHRWAVRWAPRHRGLAFRRGGSRHRGEHQRGTPGWCSLGRLARLDPEEIDAALLDALDAVITEGTFTEALAATLEKAPYVSADQRDDLRHGLEHARHGEFGRAVPPLMVGLEGALWSVARAHTVVDERHQLIGRPTTRRVRSRASSP